MERYGSPLYVYRADIVRQAYARFQGAFPYRPCQIHYAVVCNKNPYLLQLLHDLGAGVHANTPGDAYAALQAGLPPDQIVYSGTNLSSDDFDFLMRHDIPLVLDSLDQVRERARRGPGQVGLRLFLPEGAPRIGVAVDELPEALATGLAITGLHMYTATNNRRVERFLQAFDRLLEACELLPELEFVDLGGGYGVGYRRDQEDLDLLELGCEVSARMMELSERRNRRIRLVLEPGRLLVARAGTLYATVLSVKERDGRRYVGVDSTVGNIVVESVYHPYHRVEAVEPRGDLLEVPTDVCGNTTHSRDFLARGCKLPRVEPGDVLALCDVGAYGYAMSSHFLNRPRPAEVVLDGDEVHLTTRREQLEDLLATQVLR